MKLSECQCCNQPLCFENTACLRCGPTIGFVHDLVLASRGGQSAAR